MLTERLSAGCVVRPKRHSGDTHVDYATGYIDEEATNALLQEAADEIERLQKLVMHVRADEWDRIRCVAGVQGAEPLDDRATREAARRWVQETGKLLVEWQPEAAEAAGGEE